MSQICRYDYRSLGPQLSSFRNWSSNFRSSHWRNSYWLKTLIIKNFLIKLKLIFHILESTFIYFGILSVYFYVFHQIKHDLLFNDFGFPQYGFHWFGSLGKGSLEQVSAIEGIQWSFCLIFLIFKIVLWNLYYKTFGSEPKSCVLITPPGQNIITDLCFENLWQSNLAANLVKKLIWKKFRILFAFQKKDTYFTNLSKVVINVWKFINHIIIKSF